MKPRLKPDEVEEYVGNSATLAALLEVSAYPKPGNVHRLRDFHDTTYEHFLAGATALGRVMGQVARRAAEIGEPGKAEMGRGVLKAVKAVNRWHRGGNTHLGVALLFTPLSTAAGLTLINRAPTAETLREELVEAIRKAGVEDTLKLVEAVALAAPPHVLRGADKLDVTNTETRIQVVKDRVTPIELFRLCQKRDIICREWVTGFKVVFQEGYPTLLQGLEKGLSINKATVQTFLTILANHLDSLIQRKAGKAEAKRVSEKAAEILASGGVSTPRGTNLIDQLDQELSKSQGLLNPGTTADLTAASLFVLLLEGWRP